MNKILLRWLTFYSFQYFSNAFLALSPSFYSVSCRAHTEIVYGADYVIDSGERARAKNVFEECLNEGLSSKIDEALDALIPFNPTPAPGLATQAAKGRWVVCHAPHIAAGGILLRTRFVPEYWFDGIGNTSSHVKFESALYSKGWLNSDGKIYSADEGQAVVIDFNRFWVDLNRETPTRAPPSGTASNFASTLIQNLGMAAFIKPLSYYPVLYLDEDLCVFLFPPLNTRIAARRCDIFDDENFL